MASPPTPADSLDALFDMEGDVSTKSNPLNLRKKRGREEQDMAGSSALSQRRGSNRNPRMKLDLVIKSAASIEVTAEGTEEDDEEGILVEIPTGPEIQDALCTDSPADSPIHHLESDAAATTGVPLSMISLC
ncbi:hypothetical protein LWI29_003549 [Acer saccharum]|uniref:Uncharacterized protein n=1 Tax=Acer saccharum TaxID=4024 RepID=A0AA39RBW4_ACESA|nr:hypothetical protein LWI29_003549 [Acer saccharum]